MSLFNLSGIVAMRSTDTVTVRRYTAEGYDTLGKALARTFTEFTVRASVQPITGRDLDRVSREGTSGSEWVSIHCATELKEKDRVFVPSRGSFEVEHIDPWNENGSFWKVRAKQLDDQEPRT